MHLIFLTDYFQPVMVKKTKVIELEEVVVKFAGDSGDGMQLTGSQFSDTSAFVG